MREEREPVLAVVQYLLDLGGKLITSLLIICRNGRSSILSGVNTPGFDAELIGVVKGNLNMRHLFIAVAALALAAPALAQDPASVHVGQVLRDSENNRLGEISRVESDGSVQIIYQQRLAMIPASTISIADGKPKTTLTRHDLAKMH
jgi:hypothetical protein